ncbi:glycosyltransferase family 2 protein [Microbacteriaceae bacterium VKM Ac-2854]|nr:glycosyltransferase family 2 protein [Microbacteriaceae bacterium VKM Ac-2854]
MKTVVVTLCTASRLAHLRNQLRLLPDVDVVVVGLDADPLLGVAVARLLHVPPGPDGFRLAAGRNAGADAAVALGAELIVFLDADCVPGVELLERYRRAAELHPDAVLCGPVTYLAEGENARDPFALDAEADPHPARPDPPVGVVQLSTEYTLFWSLSFAVTAETWSQLRFDEAYEGYGGEDTDFAFALREQGRPLAWVGGAHAHHQWHPTSNPPWQHLDDILRNGALFASRWGTWPMTGWLERFAAAGSVQREGDGWRRV